MSDQSKQMPPLTDADLLRRAAERVLDRPGWLGQTLWRYAQSEDLPTVAAAAGTLREEEFDDVELSRLMLCRTPAGTALPRQAAEVAEAFKLDRARLISLLRRVELADAAPAPAASLLAARRDEAEPEGGDA